MNLKVEKMASCQIAKDQIEVSVENINKIVIEDEKEVDKLLSAVTRYIQKLDGHILTTELERQLLLSYGSNL